MCGPAHLLLMISAVKALAGREVVYLHQLGPTRRDGGMHEAYREAWHPMKDNGEGRDLDLCPNFAER